MNPTIEDVITDHEHKPRKKGRWNTQYCIICGYRNREHLSWGTWIAQCVGGDPLNYIDPVDRSYFDKHP